MRAGLLSLAKKTVVVASLLVGLNTMIAILFAATGQAPAALVVYPPGDYPAGLPDDVRILSWNGNVAVLTSDNSDYVRRLYAAGALLVLPVRKNGCLALRTPTSRETNLR